MENDDLPHKICFRCSAKLEELYEFIQKCIKTQENLRTAVGKTGPFITKTKTRTAWEEKLNKTNMSNDDICDALIKKAMEGIKDIPLQPVPEEKESPPPPKRVTRRNDPPAIKKDSTSDENDDKLKQAKLSLDKYDAKLSSNKPTRSSNIEVKKNIPPQNPQNEKKPHEIQKTKPNNVNSLSFDYLDEKKSSDTDEEVKIKVEKPFNIMDHISMIKVNGVGILFQCKLCNRNFLKKEVVESHTCAKNGVPKVEVPKVVPAPEPPKVSTVKYIKMEGDMKKSMAWKSYKFEGDKIINIDDTKKDESLSKDNIKKVEEIIQPAPKLNPKPRVGPASKTRRSGNDSDSGTSQKDSDSQESQTPAPSNSQAPAVHIPSVPNLNGRYKLVPGPNNIFTLIEDSSSATSQVPVKETHKSGKKRKPEPEVVNNIETKLKDRKKDSREKSTSPDVIDVENQSKPYPVGLFQTVAHSSRLYETPVPAPPAPFTTPAMKKQSYTVVQTGNPSKLLISTKAQAPPIEVPKKRQRKSKPDVREDVESKEPFRVTLEDVAPAKDAGFFTFINVDPLLQPSYVLPTDNIIQESQISTSTSVVRNEPEKETKDKDKYSCNMCGETFSREKKLLTHIQSHYTKMDEEDELRAVKGSKKRGKK